MRIRELAAVRVSYGYRRLHVLLRREGWRVNHKLVYRHYREEGLEVRTKKRRKRVSTLRIVLPAATRPNERWSMDFMSDSLHDGRRFRVLTLVDHFTRESPAIEVGSSLTGKRVVEVLERLAISHGLPQVITTDNGTEFTSRVVDEWAHRNGVKLDFIRPGKPVENAYTEGFAGNAWTKAGSFRSKMRRSGSRNGGETTTSVDLIVPWGTTRRSDSRRSGSYPGPSKPPGS